jgi:type I restriction enzyme M protein
LIVIDECNRGSAAEESAWWEILEYFSTATQIGLTATPKETEYVSNIHYFGKPVFSYSLKQGIRDGFLAPYKVIKVHLDVDVEGYRPTSGEIDINGELIEDRHYNQKDFDRVLVIDERTRRVAKWVSDYLKQSGDRFQKTIVFCVDTEHAARMRQALTNENQDLAQQNARYVMRITGDDADGQAQLGNFIDPEAKYPVLVTTSRKISAVDFNDLAERKHFGDIYEQLLNDLQSAGNAGEYYTPRAVTASMAERIDPKPGEILFDPACGTGGFLTCAIRHMRERYVKRPEDEQALQAGLRGVEKKQLPHMLCVTNLLLHGIEDPSFVRHDNTLARPYISYGQNDRVDIILTNPPFGGKEEDGIESNFPAHFRTKETADLFLALFIRLLKPGGRAAVVLPDGSLFGEGVKTRLKEHLLEECNLHTVVRLPNSVFKPYASIGTNLLFFEKGEPTQAVWFFEHRVPEGQKAYSQTRPIRAEHLQGCVDWWGGPERQGREQTDQAWRVSLDEIKARNYNLDFKNPHTIADDHGDPEELLAKLDEAEQQAAALREQLRGILAEALLR